MNKSFESSCAPEPMGAFPHANASRASNWRSRRQFLGTLSALGTGLILPNWTFAAKNARSRSQAGIIDVHRHFFPPEFIATAMEKYRPREQAIVSEWTLQKAISDMDKNGIATAILSITTPGIWVGNAEAARTLGRKCNEFAAQLVQQNPIRVGFFAAIPLPDTEGSLREIAYSLDRLGADGIGLMTSYGDKWLGDIAYSRVFDELNRRKAIVYIHPTVADCCRDLMSDVPAPLIEFPHDTTRAIASLIYSGTFERCRDIRFIFSHAGGTMPMLAGRITQLGKLFGSDKNVPNGVEYELKRLYYEIANSANRPAMSALMNLVPVSQILFGSDSPFVPTAVTADGLASLGLAQNDAEAIKHQNAEALFPRLKIRGNR
jgi:predicted TIM-barrel fold metal-dependent hydrolase